MSVIVKDGQFTELPVEPVYVAFEAGKTGVDALDVASDTPAPELALAAKSATIVRIDFPTSADGRGLSLARALRQQGYTGHLRARGHVLADQYPLALRCGFDDIEISEDHAKRQPEPQWLDAFGRVKDNYQSRLMHPLQPSPAAPADTAS